MNEYQSMTTEDLQAAYIRSRDRARHNRELAEVSNGQHSYADHDLTNARGWLEDAALIRGELVLRGEWKPEERRTLIIRKDSVMVGAIDKALPLVNREVNIDTAFQSESAIDWQARYEDHINELERLENDRLDAESDRDF